jgi:hypothetical protein
VRSGEIRERREQKTEGNLTQSRKGKTEYEIAAKERKERKKITMPNPQKIKKEAKVEFSVFVTLL